MARLGGIDRGLLSRVNPAGKRLWYVRLSVDGVMRQFGSFPTKDKARTFYETTRTQLREQKLFPGSAAPTAFTIATLTEAFLPLIAHQHDARGQRRYAAWWVAYAGEQPVFSLTLHDLEQARLQLRTNKAPGTVTHYMKFLKAAMRKVVQPRSWVIDLWAGFTFDAPTTAPTITISLKNEARLLHQLGPEEAPKARLGALTGLRRGQIFGLKWEWLRWDDQAVSLPPYKRRPARLLPLSSEASEILRTRWLAAGQPAHGWVFPDPTNSALPQDANSWYKYIYKRAVKALGLDLDGVKYHTLRHTWASRMMSVGTHPRVLQQAGGWSSMALVERYTHPHDDATRKSLEEVSNLGNSRKLQKAATAKKTTKRKSLK